jgi:hypothetical protein
MRRILRAEFPDLPVVAPSQLNPAVRIEAVGQIHLGEPR